MAVKYRVYAEHLQLVNVMDFVHVCMGWSTPSEHTCKCSHTLFRNIQWPNSGQNTHKILKNLVKISIMFILCTHLHNQTWWECYNLGWIRTREPLESWKWGLFSSSSSGGADVSDVDVLPVWVWLTQTLSNVVLGDDDTDYTTD